jgi:hypothetical protein
MQGLWKKRFSNEIAVLIVFFSQNEGLKGRHFIKRSLAPVLTVPVLALRSERF